MFAVETDTNAKVVVEQKLSPYNDFKVLGWNEDISPNEDWHLLSVGNDLSQRGKLNLIAERTVGWLTNKELSKYETQGFNVRALLINWAET